MFITIIIVISTSVRNNTNNRTDNYILPTNFTFNATAAIVLKLIYIIAYGFYKYDYN